MEIASALILGGGQSVRMKYDKKYLEIDGVKLIDSLIARLRFIFSEILVSSNTPFDYDGVTVLRDEIGAGPLAGIYQGLKHCKSEYLYVIACDMPFVSPEYVQYMSETVRAAQADICVSSIDIGLYEPFNSFYGKRCLAPIHDMLICGEYKIIPLFNKVKTWVVDPSIVARFNSRGDMFFNINCQEDLERWKKRRFC
ncbi:MAG: molybdenum cofactor guanylyltransferase [Treponemataceae bacterium]|nr:MAG: molybdenum cofactor guanylyltransferase [Treponemataceae bacterium]